MNARERMRIAMAKGVADRVPLMCQLALGHYFVHTSYDAIDIWHDSETFARALVDLQRRYGFDGILVNLPGRSPDWRRHVTKIESDPASAGGRRVLWSNGSFTVVPSDDNPHVYIAEGERRFPDFDEIDPERLYYMEPHDLSGVTYPYSWGFSREPAPPGDDGFFPPWQCATLRKVRELTAGEVSIHSEVFSPFSQLMEMLDHSAALMALVLDEGKVKAILERFAEGAVCLANLYAGAGCDALLVSSAFVGAGFLSREHYARFELPYVQRIVQGIRARHPTLPLYLHTCGAIGDRLDLMEQTGVDGIDTFDPPPLGTIELRDAVERLGQRLFIKGNIDPVHTLLRGTPDDVRAAALERLEIAKPGGAYILSSACSVPPRTDGANILQLRAAVEEAGSYA